MRGSALIYLSVSASIAVLGGLAISAQDKYTVKVPGGLAFSEFRGYEAWQVIAISRNGEVVAVILGNPAMIEAYRPAFPATASLSPTAPGWRKSIGPRKRTRYFPAGDGAGRRCMNVDFMVKDSKRFADSGGWGYAVFEYDAASDTFTPGTTAGTPPQGNDAKCGFACHTGVQNRDYVFTEYGKR